MSFSPESIGLSRSVIEPIVVWPKRDEALAEKDKSLETISLVKRDVQKCAGGPHVMILHRA